MSTKLSLHSIILNIYGRGLGANVVGQSANMPLVGLVEQLLLPPPQLGMPEDPMREAPIISTTVPVC